MQALDVLWEAHRLKTPSHPRAQATTTIMPAVETFEGQLTRANVTLAVRSGVLTEAEAARYWQSRRKFRTLSDSNSQKTIEKHTQVGFRSAKCYQRTKENIL